MLIDILEAEYSLIREIPFRGFCGLCRMLYTTGLFYGLDETGYAGRYCYSTMSEAKEAINSCDGQGDPAGGWIKHIR